MSEFNADTVSDTVPDHVPDQPNHIDSLREDVLNQVQKINEDFVVVSSYVADYDKDGAKTEVRCVNRWCGWSWDLDHEIKAHKQALYNNVIKYKHINVNGEKIVENDTISRWIFG